VGNLFFWDGMEDKRDATGISGSGLFDMTDGPIEMGIPWSEQYTKTLLRGGHHTLYTVLLIPKKIKVADFHTIREAVDNGAVALGGTTGPP
jgi:hypothetical protein